MGQIYVDGILTDVTPDNWQQIANQVIDLSTPNSVQLATANAVQEAAGLNSSPFYTVPKGTTIATPSKQTSSAALGLFTIPIIGPVSQYIADKFVSIGNSTAPLQKSVTDAAGPVLDTAKAVVNGTATALQNLVAVATILGIIYIIVYAEKR